MGLGKPRSKYGKVVDANRITQEEIVKETRLGKNTVSRACSDDSVALNRSTKRMLSDAVKKLTGKNVSDSDFW